MTDVLSQFDWNQARAFLATARHGSLSGAARALGMTQPTLSRQIAALEQDLGLLLFDRIGKTLVLTAAGRELLDHVEAMGAGAERLALSAAGQVHEVEGRVCITASDVMAALYLPAMIARLRIKAPKLDVQINVSGEMKDLQRREADIAIRHVRPTTGDLIAKLVHETQGLIYGTPAYLRSIDNPVTTADLSRAAFVGFEPLAQMIEIMATVGVNLTPANFPYITDNGMAAWELTKQGLCLCVMMQEVGRATPEVVQSCPGMQGIAVPFWLTTHRELHTSRRIRVVFDHLAEELGRL